MREIKAVGLFATLLALGAVSLAASAQSPPVVFTLKQEGSGGGALSADGTKIAYVADDHSLRVVEIASRKERVVWRPQYDVEVFRNPSFSPDGSHIVFEMGGATMHYPSEIYSVQVNGTDLRQLTHQSEPVQLQSPEGGYAGGRFFYTPRYSPDGSQILVWQSSEVSEGDQGDFAAVVSPSSSDVQVLTNGKPLGWAAGGKAIFVESDQCVCRYDLDSKTTKAVPGLRNASVLGILRGSDIFAVGSNGWLGLVTVADTTAGPPKIILPLGTEITQVESDQSRSYLLLRYEAELLEVLQIVKLK